MRITASPYNLYLLLAATVAILVAGCQSAADRARAKEVSTLRLHLEVNPDTTGHNSPVPVFRETPMLVNVQNDSFLDEAHVELASVQDDPRGGFFIRIQFDSIATSLLNATTLANPGRRIAVASQFPGHRWLAAPVIQRRIADGVFTFTPDASREEAERVVRGLNNAIYLAKKRSLVY
jgi:preprotein translocase subunit SecD